MLVYIKWLKLIPYNIRSYSMYVCGSAIHLQNNQYRSESPKSDQDAIGDSTDKETCSGILYLKFSKKYSIYLRW